MTGNLCTGLFLGHVLIDRFDRFSRLSLQFSPFFAYKMLLYSDIISGDEMFSDAFPMFVLSHFCCFFANPFKANS